MGVIGGQLGYKLLKSIGAQGHTMPPQGGEEKAGKGITRAQVELLFGEDFVESIAGRTVIDFGCGNGEFAVKMVELGAARVFGVDIQEHRLKRGQIAAMKAGVADRCTFEQTASEPADVIVSKDAFEHYEDPARILEIMATHLKPGGRMLASFGPTWLHPYGGHLFSVFPWSHLVFTEEAQIRWRSDFKTDGATRFSEVEGGLNQMTIAQFERLVEDSPFRLKSLDTIPIKGLALFKTRPLREIGSSIVRCELELK